MSDILRSLLAAHFGSDHRIIAHFEDQARVVDETSEAASGAAAATDKLQEATVVVLSSNQAFTNERILRRGPGIRMVDTGTALIVQASDMIVELVADGNVNLAAGKVVKIDETQVVTAQQPAVADDVSGAVNQATVNAILAALRAHGLIAT